MCASSTTDTNSSNTQKSDSVLLPPAPRGVPSSGGAVTLAEEHQAVADHPKAAEGVLPNQVDEAASLVNVATNTPLSPMSEEEAQFEVVGGFRVHPLASRFPLLQGKDFDGLVESIRLAGKAIPIEFHEGLLIDGRNRVRSIEELRKRGHAVEIDTIEWCPTGDETVEEHILAANLYRRHLTDDQRAIIAAELLPVIRAAKATKQASTRFGGVCRAAVPVRSSPPYGMPPTRRTRQDKVSASTIGQIASLAKVTPHKAGQAVALSDAVAAGTVPATEVEAVRDGKKRLRETSPPRRKPRPKPTPPPTPRQDAETIFDTFDESPDADMRGALDAPDVTEEEVRQRWERFKLPFAIADHRELRGVISMIVAEEQRAFDWR
jgi:hypothetical protein